MIKKGVKYFKTWAEAWDVKKSIEGRDVYFFGKRVKAEPRVVSYDLGYAVQYIKSGRYYPEQEGI